MQKSNSEEQLFYQQTILIKAPLPKVWDALINPEMTKQYMFGCIPVTDWKVGSEVLWKGAEDGVTYVKGELVKFEPKSILTYTTFAPHSELEDIPENYLTGEIRLSEENGKTKLELTQGDFNTVGDGQKRFKETQGAWEMTFQILKQILEG